MKTHCKAGHPWDENDVVVKRNGTKVCRECKNAEVREYHRRARAAYRVFRNPDTVDRLWRCVSRGDVVNTLAELLEEEYERFYGKA